MEKITGRKARRGRIGEDAVDVEIVAKDGTKTIEKRNPEIEYSTFRLTDQDTPDSVLAVMLDVLENDTKALLELLTDAIDRECFARSQGESVVDVTGPIFDSFGFDPDPKARKSFKTAITRYANVMGVNPIEALKLALASKKK